MLRCSSPGLVLALAIALGAALPAAAHQAQTVQVGVSFPQAGSWRLDVVLDREHLPALPASSPAAPVDVRGFTPALDERYGAFVRAFLAHSVLSFDGRRAAPETVGLLASSEADPLPLLRLEGRVPAGAQHVTFASGFETGTWIVRVRRRGPAPAEAQFLKAGETSRPAALAGREPPPGGGSVFQRFLGLGFTHILPKGADHMLFVLGIFLLSVRLKPMLLQVTAFTVAHTIALGLTMYGVFSLPSSVVEPLIALSIVYVGVENTLTSRLTVWRPAVVFGFGLLHWMGFADALREIGLPRADFATALFAFNLGVEAGQVSVLMAAFVLLGLPFRDRPWYRSRVTVPGSLLVAVVGAFWFVQRVR